MLWIKTVVAVLTSLFWIEGSSLGHKIVGQNHAVLNRAMVTDGRSLITDDTNIMKAEHGSYFCPKLLVVIFIIGLVIGTSVLCFFLTSGGNDKAEVTGQQIKVKLGFIGPLDNSLGATTVLGKELESAFKLAVELINEEAALRNSKVNLSIDFSSMVKDGGRNPGTMCKLAAQQLAADSEIVGVVGAFRSSCSIASHQYFRENAPTLTQISYGSTSTKLSDKKKYPRFFRTIPSDEHQARALRDLVTNYNWRKIGIISSTDDYPRMLSDTFESQVKLKGVRVIDSPKFSAGAKAKEISKKLQQLKDARTRVNVIFGNPQDVKTAFLQAKLKGMTGQGWVWLGGAGMTSLGVLNHATLRGAMKGAVGTMPKMGSKAKYLALIVKWLKKKSADYPGIIHSVPPTTSAFVPQVYDAVYAYYHAFDRLARAGKISPVHSASVLRKVVFDELSKMKDKKTGFVGAAGEHVYFDSHFDAPSVYDIGNLQATQPGGTFVTWKKVGTWKQGIGVEVPSGKVSWPGGTQVPPGDTGRPGKTTFKIGFITPTSPGLAGLSQLGKEFESAFKVAVEMMNKDLSLSIDFDVKIHDGGVDPKKTCKRVAEKLVQEGVVAVIGAYRSECTMAAAEVLGKSNRRIPLISYASTAAQLSDKKKYKYFLRTCPSDSHQADALAALFRVYGWPQVGTIATTDTYGQGLSDEFEKRIKKVPVPVSVTSSQRFPINARAGVVRPKVEKLKESGSKVNLISMVRHDAETVFQQIKELDMTGKGWIWLGTDGSTSSTFTRSKSLERAMQGMLGTQPKNGEGSLYLSFLAEWLKKDPTTYPGIVHSKPFHAPSSAVSTAQLFDAVHGVALALSDLVNKKIILRSTPALTVRDRLFTKLKSFNRQATGFPSATGTNNVMYFDSNGDGPPLYDIVNLVGNNWITVGQYKPQEKQITIGRDPVFPGGSTIPRLGTGKPTYKIAAFLPKSSQTGPLGSIGREWEAAFRVAVEVVNSDPTFRVAFNYILVDGGPSEQSCRERAQALPDDIDVIIGGARSSCSKAIADATKSRKIPQISYASTAVELSNKKNYPYFFRTCAPDSHQAIALALLVRRFKWDKVGTIATTDMYAENLARMFALQVRKLGVAITGEERFDMHSDDVITDNVKALKSAGSGVNVISAITDDAERVFQEAIEQGMTGKGWTWLGTDGSTSSTFESSPNLQRHMQGMVGTRPKKGEGRMYRNLLNTWAEKDSNVFPGLVHSSRAQQASVYTAQVYDAVLAFAHALTRLHEEKNVTANTPRSEMQEKVVSELRRMKDPRSGFDSALDEKQYFDSNQDSRTAYDIVNLNGDLWTKVGEYTKSRGLRLDRKIVWSGGSLSIPTDEQPRPRVSVERMSESGVSREGFVALGAVFGTFTLVVVALVAFLIHRERTGRASFSPRVFRRSPINESPLTNGGTTTMNDSAKRSTSTEKVAV